MKTILIFILFSFNCSAQSLYNAHANEKNSYTDQENFTITFTKSLYGLTFERNGRKLNKSLKQKIERFKKNTNRSKYKGLGEFTLNILKRDNQYFIVETKKPEKLLKL